MLQKESVKNRMEAGISFTEFSYMLVQAHDFWHLNATQDIELQMGGSDQWGNITAGIELIHRREGRSAHGLVLPLLTTAAGAKFGKSEEGNVWLDPAKTSPYKFFQFWLNADDRDVGAWLRIFTFLPLEEIDALLEEHAAAPGQRAAQRRLAREVTATVHGFEVAERVIAASAILFGGTDLRSARADVLSVLADEVPTVPVQAAAIAEGVPLVDALLQAGLASSKSDARRGLQQRGFSVNGEPVAEADRKLGTDDLVAGRFIVLQKGKKNYAMLRIHDREERQ
jgi:tyrosyl-tRNA synthetase